LGILGHRQRTLELVVGAEAEASLGVHIRQVDTQSHKGCTVVEGMAVGIGIHKEVDDSSGHACTQGWHYTLTQSQYHPTVTHTDHLSAAISGCLGRSSLAVEEEGLTSCGGSHHIERRKQCWLGVRWCLERNTFAGWYFHDGQRRQCQVDACPSEQPQ
jgi:hypothetical protein